VLALAITGLGFAARRYAGAAEISVWPIILEHVLIALAVLALWFALALIPRWRPLSRRVPLLCWVLAALALWSAASLFTAMPEATRLSAELHRMLGRTPAEADSSGASSPRHPALGALRTATDTLEVLSARYERLTRECAVGAWLLPERLESRERLIEDRQCSDRLIAAGESMLAYYPRYRAHLRAAFAQLGGPHRHLGRAAGAGLEPAVAQAEELFASNVAVARRHRQVFDTLLQHWNGFEASPTGIAFHDAATESTLSRELTDLARLLERHEELAQRAQAVEDLRSARGRRP
jgi:hypothetical protein